MVRRLAHCAIGGLLIVGLVGCYVKGDAPAERPRGQQAGARDIGPKLFAQAGGAAPEAPAEPPSSVSLGEPIVIPKCRVTFTLNGRVDIPSQRDGVVSYFFTEVGDDEKDKYPP